MYEVNQSKTKEKKLTNSIVKSGDGEYSQSSRLRKQKKKLGIKHKSDGNKGSNVANENEDFLIFRPSFISSTLKDFGKTNQNLFDLRLFQPSTCRLTRRRMSPSAERGGLAAGPERKAKRSAKDQSATPACWAAQRRCEKRESASKPFNKPPGSTDSAPAAYNPDTPAVLPVESGLPVRF